MFEEITGGGDVVELGKREVASRAYVSWFNFKGASQQSKVGQLSGGERNRVHLAKLLKGGANLLLLDEPTNDLDVNTLRALEEALLNFGGCAVVISHDRWFLDRIATHILAFEGDSKVVWFEGNYQDYEADRHRRLGAEADQPHRIKYRKAHDDRLCAVLGVPLAVQLAREGMVDCKSLLCIVYGRRIRQESLRNLDSRPFLGCRKMAELPKNVVGGPCRFIEPPPQKESQVSR